MSLPPVIAELRASIGDFQAKMGLARDQWASTAGVISDPAPLLAAQRGMTELATHAETTARSAAVLGETSRETFRSMTSGITSVLPGFSELTGVTGRVREQFLGIGEAARAGMETAARNAEALKLQIARVNVALDAEIAKTEAVAVGSRAWQVAATRVLEYRAQIDKLNANLVETAAAEKKAAAEGARRQVKSVALGGVAVGAAVGAGVAYEGVKAALAEASAEALLRNAVDKTKESFAAFEPHLRDAQGQMRNYGFSNAETAAAAQKLTTTLHDPEKALNLVGLAANVARARHIDLASATTLVSKAAAGNTSVLTRMGLASKDAAGNTLTAKAAIDRLGQAYGGAAQAYGSTLQGKWDKFKAQLDDVLERIGAKLIPMLSNLLTKFMDLAGWLNQHVVPVLKDLAGFYKQHATLINTLAIAVVTFVTAFKTVALVKTIIIGVRDAMIALNVAMDANPVGLVIAAIAALALGFIYAWKKSETFRDTVKGVWNAILTATQVGVSAFIKLIVAWALAPVYGIDLILKALSHLPEHFGGGAASGAEAAVSALIGQINSWRDSAINAINDVIQAAKALPSAMSLYGSSDYSSVQGFGTDAAAITAEMNKQGFGVAKAAGGGGVNIGSGYGTGLSNVAKAAKAAGGGGAGSAAKSAHAAAMAKAHAKAAAHKADMAAKRKAAHEKLVQHRAEVAAAKAAAKEAAAQKKQELADAKAAAAAVVAQQKADIAAAKQAALALTLANRAAAAAAVSIFDGGVLNRGADFAQTVAANNAATSITVNVAGHVTTERDLLASIHESLLTFGRTNIGTGLA